MTKKQIVSQSQLLKTLDRHPATPTLLNAIPPRAAAALFQRIGIYDAAALMTMVPADTLLRALDESIWKSPQPGAPERVDPAELIEWLDTWHDIGERFLLDRIAAMSDDYLVLLLSRIVQVNSENLHPECDAVVDAFVEKGLADCQRFGPFEVQAVSDEHNDTVQTTLNALWIDCPDRMLRLLNRLSITPDTYEFQRGWMTTALDVEYERRSFREAHGYVSGDDARAFLSYALSVTPQHILTMTGYDAHTARHLTAVGNASAATNPIHAEHDLNRATDTEPDSSGELVISPSLDQDLPALLALLQNAELLDSSAAPLLLTSENKSEEAQLVTQLRLLAGCDVDAFQQRTKELAYLANTLLAAVGVNGSALSDLQAKDAALAICCLGLDLAQTYGVNDLRDEPGLVRLFLLGWNAVNIIPKHIALAFERAFSHADTLRPWIREEARVGVDDLRTAVNERRWEDARDAIVFLSIAFNSATCRAIVPLLDEIPRYSLLLNGGKRLEDARWIASKKDMDRIGSLISAISLK
jgi:hypothetical protein